MYIPNFIISFLLVLTTVNYSNGAPVKRQTSTTPITYAQFCNLPLGSTPDQITQNFNGNPGVVTYQSDAYGVNVEMIQYSSDVIPVYAVDLTLTNGILTIKAQSGLDTTSHPITLDQYHEITTGMSQDAVTSLVGEGQILGEGEGGVEIIGYNGSGSTPASAIITYVNGAVLSTSEYGLYN